jgi:hypothetical protein
MRKFALAFIILIGVSCKKEKTAKLTETPQPEIVTKCGKIITTPILDSFVYPTCYLTTTIAFDDGNEVVHLQYNVPGDHDGSWFTGKYDKDSTYCMER